jgi:hypothetical protein
MLNIIFTSDYEIHGNGEGSPLGLMIDPTYRNLDLFEKYGAKLTIMADVAQILQYKKYKEEAGKDTFYYNDIVLQLQDAIKRGHDVQLHLHPHFFEANYMGNKWNFDSSDYLLESSTYEELYQMIKTARDFLYSILKAKNNHYECIAFRAGGWEMQPSKNIVRALIDNGFLIDTSLFKNGKRNGMYKFDYSKAQHNLLPWLVDENEICRFSPNGKLLEIPIYSSQKNLFSFLSINRLFRIAKQKKNVHPKNRNGNKSYLKKIKFVFKSHPLKMDFNQCSGTQLIKELKFINQQFGSVGYDIPVVLIGHSKSFTKYNEKSLQPFLKYIKHNPGKYRFSLFSELDLAKLKKIWD